MRLDATSGLRGMWVDWDTSRPIRFVRWADLETGEYAAFAVGADGQMEQPPRLVQGHARLKFIPAAPPLPKTTDAAEDACYLTAVLQEQGGSTRILALPGRACEERACHRLATWQTAEELAIEPQIGPDGRRYERALTTRVHYWCDLHFRLPVHTSLRGVESEVPVRVRPQ